MINCEAMPSAGCVRRLPKILSKCVATEWWLNEEIDALIWKFIRH